MSGGKWAAPAQPALRFRKWGSQELPLDQTCSRGLGNWGVRGLVTAAPSSLPVTSWVAPSAAHHRLFPREFHRLTGGQSPAMVFGTGQGWMPVTWTHPQTGMAGLRHTYLRPMYLPADTQPTCDLFLYISRGWSQTTREGQSNLLGEKDP